jgi:hypothetical protein
MEGTVIGKEEEEQREILKSLDAAELRFVRMSRGAPTRQYRLSRGAGPYRRRTLKQSSFGATYQADQVDAA